MFIKIPAAIKLGTTELFSGLLTALFYRCRFHAAAPVVVIARLLRISRTDDPYETPHNGAFSDHSARA